jgi:DNA-binding NarL/FixJ family response regulator
MVDISKLAHIRLLIADDHPLLREGVASVVQTYSDIELVGEASDGLEAIQKYRDLQPDVALIDLQMPGMQGVDVIKAIRAEFPKARLIVLTTYSGDVQALRAMKAGASGYLLKSTLRLDLVEVIRRIHAGGRHLAPDIANDIGMNAVKDMLSTREIAILELVAGGYANKEIARQLQIVEETVKAHLKSIFAKLEVNDRTHAVTVAARRGIIDLSPRSPS